MMLAKPLTKEQRQAVKRLYERSADGEATYLRFRRRFRQNTLMGCVMGRWCGMHVGIEADGHIGS